VLHSLSVAQVAASSHGSKLISAYKEVFWESAKAAAHAAEAILPPDAPVSARAKSRRKGIVDCGRAMAEDHRKLRVTDLGAFPDLGDPIDSSELGPLWPDGEPDWYREGCSRGKWGTSFPAIGTPEWGQMNRTRADLIQKKNRQGLTTEEQAEYERLQRLSHEALEAQFPRPVTGKDEDKP
jgi:hypothetical protein